MFKAEETMYGTSGATFTQVASFGNARVGYRSIGGGQFRVRIEVANGTVLNLGSDWKTPADGCPRYSTVVSGHTALVSAIQTATAAVVAAQVVDPNAAKLAQIESLKAQVNEITAQIGSLTAQLV